MTSYGMNPQGGQMAPLDLEVGETCALGHMGWHADGVRAFGVNSVCTSTVCPCLYELSIPVRVVAMSGCAVILEDK